MGAKLKKTLLDEARKLLKYLSDTLRECDKKHYQYPLLPQSHGYGYLAFWQYFITTWLPWSLMYSDVIAFIPNHFLLIIASTEQAPRKGKFGFSHLR